MARKRPNKAPPAPALDGRVTTMTGGEMMEHLKRSIIAAHSPGHDPAWWVETHEMYIRMSYACAGAMKVADPFVLGTGFDPVGCCGGDFKVRDRADYRRLVAPEVSTPVLDLPAPAAGHFSVVVVLEGEAYHFELPVPTASVVARSVEAG
jgi:hypothetical protein